MTIDPFSAPIFHEKLLVFATAQWYRKSPSSCAVDALLLGRMSFQSCSASARRRLYAFPSAAGNRSDNAIVSASNQARQAAKSSLEGHVAAQRVYTSSPVAARWSSWCVSWAWGEGRPLPMPLVEAEGGGGRSMD